MQGVTKTGLIAINLVVFFWGIGQIIGSSVMLQRGDPYRVAQDFASPVHITNIVVGVLIIILAFLGFFGVLRNNPFMIKLYACLMMALFVIEIILIVVIFCLVGLADSTLTGVVDNIFANYGEPAHMNVTYTLDLIQHLHSCCGVRNYTDWEKYSLAKKSPQSVADGCCKSEYFAVGCGKELLAKPDAESMIHTRGCFYVLKEFVIGGSLALGFILFVVAIFQLMCSLAAFRLQGDIKQKNLRREMHELEQKPLQDLGNTEA